MSKKRLAILVVEILAGIILLGLGIAGKLDEFWSGMGGALIGVGGMYLVQTIRYHKNEAYRENVNTERNDERNRFLYMKAWQMVGSWFVIIAAVATFVFKFAGKEDLMMLCGGAVGLMTFMYWIFFLYLRKKY
jgi:predicted histidine transporter YuiF (NhaC family)